jgi:hypothetical protein
MPSTPLLIRASQARRLRQSSELLPFLRAWKHALSFVVGFAMAYSRRQLFANAAIAAERNSPTEAGLQYPWHQHEMRRRGSQKRALKERSHLSFSFGRFRKFSVMAADVAADMARGDIPHADTTDSVETRTASFADLRHHVVRLKRRERHCLCR